MHGTIILCSVHIQVYHSVKREWQPLSKKMLDELRELAEEVGGVDVYEGCCPKCNEIASGSFHHLYGLRYATAMTVELGYDVVPRLDDVDIGDIR